MNQWIFFNDTNDNTNRIEFYITGIISDYPTKEPTRGPVKPPSKTPTLNPVTKYPTSNPNTPTPTKSPTLNPTITCDEIRVSLPAAFPDQIAVEIFNTPFIHQGSMHQIYPYWAIDCDNQIDEYTQGCKDGYAGIIYFNGNDQWIISIHSENNDYYKIYATTSVNNFVPLSAIWIDIDTQQGISQSTYQFILTCNSALTLPPIGNTIADKRTIETEYIYVKTWFWITIILIVLFMAVICLLFWMFMRRRKGEPKDNDNPNVELNVNHLGEDLVSAHEPLPKLMVPKHQPIPTQSTSFTPKTPNEQPSPLVPVLSALNNNAHSTTPQDGNPNETTTGIEWGDEYDKIFSV
eukprot:803719_1